MFIEGSPRQRLKSVGWNRSLSCHRGTRCVRRLRPPLGFSPASSAKHWKVVPKGQVSLLTSALSDLEETDAQTDAAGILPETSDSFPVTESDALFAAWPAVYVLAVFTAFLLVTHVIG